MNNPVFTKRSALSVTLTVIILGILIIAGPAQGFVLSLGLDNATPTQGDIITFTAEVDISSSEQLPLSELNLRLVGPTNYDCKFQADGTIISGCQGITITPSSSSSFGYGYGYGYQIPGSQYNFGYGYGYQQGTLPYVITLDTSFYTLGDYQTFLDVLISSNTFTKQGSNLLISSSATNSINSINDDIIPGNGGGSCYTTWVCSEWNQCTSGEQTRTCEKLVQGCTAGPIPPTQQSCSSSVQPLNLPNSNGEENPEDLVETDTSVSPSQVANRISGAVVAATSSSSFIPALILVLGLVALGITLRMRRKPQPKSPDSFY